MIFLISLSIFVLKSTVQLLWCYLQPMDISNGTYPLWNSCSFPWLIIRTRWGKEFCPLSKIMIRWAPSNVYIILIQFWLTYLWQDENAKALWIHHWIVLQLVHPYFRPRNGYEFSESYVPLKDNGMKFIHDNFVDYIMTTNDDEFKEQYELSLGCSPPNKLAYGIVWKGTIIE